MKKTTRKKRHSYRRKHKTRIRWGRILSCLIAIVLLLALFGNTLYQNILYPFLIQPFTVIEAVYPDEVYGVPVVTSIIPEGRQNRPGIKRTIQHIVIHETDNTASTANAKNHNDYLCKNKNVETSWHYTVDDHEIYHNLPDDEVGWHASDGLEKNGGNLNGIGIEICVNDGSDFDTTLDNTARLVAYLLNAYRLDREDITQHHDYTSKNCPRTLRDTGQWDDFLELVDYYRKTAAS